MRISGAMKKSDVGKPWAAYRDRRRTLREEHQYILVVSEDEKSSVFYFEFLNNLLRAHSATVGIIPKGTGRNTQGLIRFVEKNKLKWLKDVRADIAISDFDEIWVVFDRDSFPEDQFDNAIDSAKKHGYQVAWSNECFELWYLLHFKEVVAGISRNAIYEALTREMKLSKKYVELKGDEGIEIHQKMVQNPNIRKAIKRAKKLYEEFCASKIPPHAGNPCTLMFLLIEKLLKQLEK